MHVRKEQESLPDPTRKPQRNAAATRRAILDSARRAFTQFGYHGVGVREIAQNAGVTAMLVNRYFGSKEKLFEEVTEETLAVPGILKAEIARTDKDMRLLGKALADALVAATSPDNSLDGILLLIRSAANEQAAAILRKSALRHLAPLADILPGKQAAEKAAMFLAVAAGFQLMRRVIALSALTEADPEGLSRQLQAMIECLLDGKDPEADSSPGDGDAV